MNDRDRLDQLRGLLDRLERMPASPDRDWTLAEIRARVVDVETGTPPTPMRPRQQDELAAELAAEQVPRTAPVKRAKTPSRRAQRVRLEHPATRTPPARFASGTRGGSGPARAGRRDRPGRAVGRGERLASPVVRRPARVGEFRAATEPRDCSCRFGSDAVEPVGGASGSTAERSRLAACGGLAARCRARTGRDRTRRTSDHSRSPPPSPQSTARRPCPSPSSAPRPPQPPPPIPAEDEHRGRRAHARADRKLTEHHHRDQDGDRIQERGIYADRMQEQPVAEDLSRTRPPARADHAASAVQPAQHRQPLPQLAALAERKMPHAGACRRDDRDADQRHPPRQPQRAISVNDASAASVASTARIGNPRRSGSAPAG